MLHSASATALTKGIRELASDEIKNRLFIYRSSSARTFFEIKSLASSSENVINKLFDKYAKVSGILGDDGKQLSLSASRFRPSFVSELVEKGVSIREIQLMLGHGSIKTTLSYLDRMDFNKIAREKINTKLIEIHGSTIREPQKLGGGSTPEPSKNSPDSGEIFFKTPLAGCKNIFDPPDFIKKISSYTPGRPCSIYNRCLSCDNVIITISNLPELFAMQRDYLILTESSRVMDTPYGQVVRENLELLSNILSVDRSDFTEAELIEAERLSEFVETTILADGVSN